MITRSANNTWFLNCNVCGREKKFYTDDKMDVVAACKQDGWKIKKVDDEWEHICPNCRTDRVAGVPKGGEDFL